MTRLVFAFAALFVISTTIHAAEPAKPKSEPRAIEGWGTVLDQDGDCKVTGDSKQVSFTIPGTIHDLFPPNSLMNAPRILQPVKGDFSVQVKVTADFDPGKVPTKGFNRAFHAGGLLIWINERNYIRMERSELVFQADGRRLYFSPSLQMCLAGTYYEDLGPRAASTPFFTEPSTFLRIDRKGDAMTAYFSPDGKQWQPVKAFNAFTDETLQVGICAINTSSKEFKVTFEGLKIGPAVKE